MAHRSPGPWDSRETAKHADGAIVMVLASEKAAQNLAEKPIWILGIGWVNGSASLESRDWGKADYLEPGGSHGLQSGRD